MFGAHRRKAEETGQAIRNSFASVSMNTELFELSDGFKPNLRFMQDPYVAGFFLYSVQLFRTFVWKGSNWRPQKTGEFVSRAFDACFGPENGISSGQYMDLIQKLSGDESFSLGKQHAETYFGAQFGMLPQTDADPIVVEARKKAESLQRMYEIGFQPGGQMDKDAGFKLAVTELTLKKEFEKRFPS